MTLVRRAAIAVIVAAAVWTVLFGVFWIAVAVSEETDPLWRLIGGVAGVAGAAVGATCAWLAASDLRRGVLSPRASRWTWAATGLFAVLSILTVWYAVLGLIGPLVTLVFVRLASWVPRRRVVIN